MTVANILDPIQPTLDPTVWDKPGSEQPRLKPQHLHWIKDSIYRALTKHGYEHPEDWLSLYVTGSLTTYQYGPDSDCDTSLFVNTEAFPEWSRAEMIGIMISEFDGTLKVPGTTHPLQAYVVPGDLKPADLYKHGLRSAYSIDNDNWFIPPEHDRVHDVQKEFRRGYIEALEDADKMESLIKYEPQKAVQYYKQIHRRRAHDQAEGKGDYSDSNIVYKYLDKRGLTQQVAQIGGFKVAKEAQHELGDWKVGYMPLIDVAKIIDHCGDYGQLWWDPKKHKVIWNAGDADGGEDTTSFDEIKRRFLDVDGVDDVEIGDEMAQPEGTTEIDYHDHKTASPLMDKIVRKFVYNDQTGLKTTEFGREEGEVPSHNQLGRSVGIQDPLTDAGTVVGTISPNGWVQFEAGGGGPRVRYRAQQAIRDAFPDVQGFLGGEVSDFVGTGGGQWSF